MPNVFNVWKRQADNLCTVFGYVYGHEHRRDMQNALNTLQQWHEKDQVQYPFLFVQELFEELLAYYVEGIREKRRQFLRTLEVDNPRKEDLKFAAFLPIDCGGGKTRAALQFRNCWNLEDPTGY